MRLETQNRAFFIIKVELAGLKKEKKEKPGHIRQKRKLDFLNYTEQELSCDQQEADNSPLRFLFAPLRLAERGPLCV